MVGASRGLGLAIVEELSKRGNAVAGTMRLVAPALMALANEKPRLVETVDIDGAA